MWNIKQIFLLLLLFCCACDTNSKIDREAVNTELKNRKIKKVKEAEILEEGLEMGRKISKESEKALLDLLQNAIAAHGIEGAVEFCNTSINPLMDSLENVYPAKISRTSHKLRNPDNKPDDIEAEILDAYLYNEEAGLDLHENVQLVNDEYVLYNRPIKVGTALCLNCHGDHVQENVLKKIRSLYPDDQAIRFQLGDFRGMWNIKLSKKEIVLGL